VESYVSSKRCTTELHFAPLLTFIFDWQLWRKVADS
jgi:hypothetical protein